MTAPAWMPLYIADYLADTGHLSTIEHGAYVLLIMHYWQHKSLPPEDKLARVARMTAKEWAASRDTLASLFGANWKHKRVERELSIAEQIADKRSTAGRVGGLASSTARQRRVNGSLHDQPTNGQANVNPLPSPSPEERLSSVGNSRPREAERFESELRTALGERSPPENVDFAPILALIEAGFDPIKDILAACRTAAGKTAESIGSWQYYATAVGRKPKETPSQPVTWVPKESPMWIAAASRYKAERGKDLLAVGSAHGQGVGAFVPKAWLEERAAA